MTASPQSQFPFPIDLLHPYHIPVVSEAFSVVAEDSLQVLSERSRQEGSGQ